MKSNDILETYEAYLLARSAAHVADDLLFDFYERNKNQMSNSEVVFQLLHLEEKCQMRDKAFAAAQSAFHRAIGLV